MPIDRKALEVPALSASEIADAKDKFLHAMRKELAVRGEFTPEMRTLLASQADRLTVTPRFAGPETRYSGWESGGRLDPQQATDDLLEMAREQARVAAFGPDPLQMLVDRLVTAGVPREEAEERAQGRVRRDERLGHVTAFTRTGAVLHETPVPEHNVTLSDEQLAKLRDANPAVTRVAREILIESEAGLPAQSAAPAAPPIDNRARSAF